MTDRRSGKIWAITCYFNPAGYRQRLANYRVFRRRLRVPLLCVEWSTDGSYDLHDDDADQLIRVQGGDVMWQKERLLNLGVSQLPDDCVYVAWVDCDVVFERDDWLHRACDALRRYRLVHLYSRRHNLAANVDITDNGRLASDSIASSAESVIHKRRQGQTTPGDFLDADAPLKYRTTVGLAWAAHRELLLRHGLYDACVLGSGDRVILAAAMGQLDWGVRVVQMNPRWAAHFCAWARPFSEAIKGRVGCLAGTIAHLWHGEMRDRRYGERHHVLRQHQFDPTLDLTQDNSGVWRWDSPKSAMHRQVFDYFTQRREDE